MGFLVALSGVPKPAARSATNFVSFVALSSSALTKASPAQQPGANQPGASSLLSGNSKSGRDSPLKSAPSPVTKLDRTRSRLSPNWALQLPSVPGAAEEKSGAAAEYLAEITTGFSLEGGHTS
jgi:hypothetical protein